MNVGRIVASVTIENAADLSKTLRCDALISLKRRKIVIFLIEYDRARGEIVTVREFDDSARTAADSARLELELERNREGSESEVVLLEAASEEALRRTHRCYFEDLNELVKTS
jgi:hypothetical protein